MKLNIGYKLVEYKGGEWKSVNCVYTDKSQLTYRLDETTTPICGKLFIFKTLEDAQAYKLNFYESNRRFAIFQGIAKNKKQIELPGILGYSGIKEYLCSFWESVKNGQIKMLSDINLNFGGSSCIPKHTWVCDTFKPLKRIL